MIELRPERDLLGKVPHLARLPTEPVEPAGQLAALEMAIELARLLVPA